MPRANHGDHRTESNAGLDYLTSLIRDLSKQHVVRITSDRVALTSPPSQQPGREKQQSPEQRKYSFHRDSNQTQGQRQQPDKRKQNQRKHRQRPAEREQDAPTDKQNQCLHIARILSRAAVKAHYN